MVAAELGKQSGWSQTAYRLHHFRDSNGPEVDLIVELSDGRVIGLEVKAASSVGTSDFKGLRYLRDRLGDQFAGGAVLHTGSDAIPWGGGLMALPVSSLWSHTAQG
jgi:predicted AAA+ superfamily ATPase